jgi:hypothetical protein
MAMRDKQNDHGAKVLLKRLGDFSMIGRNSSSVQRPKGLASKKLMWQLTLLINLPRFPYGNKAG